MIYQLWGFAWYCAIDSLIDWLVSGIEGPFNYESYFLFSQKEMCFLVICRSGNCETSFIFKSLASTRHARIKPRNMARDQTKAAGELQLARSLHWRANNAFDAHRRSPLLPAKSHPENAYWVSVFSKQPFFLAIPHFHLTFSCRAASSFHYSARCMWRVLRLPV